MKHFLVYTALRLGLFLATYAVLSTLALAIFGQETSVWVWSLVAAAVVSSVLSLWLLAGPRERFAQSVQARAENAQARFEEMKAREDVD
ncbi:MAG TPA: DUF4229 domain-containing protein [Marmoricola sp.]